MTAQIAAFPSDRLRRAAEAVLIPVGALLVAMVLFGAFMALVGKDPLEVYALIYKGGFSQRLRLAEHAAARGAA